MEHEIHPEERRPEDFPAKVRITRARVITWHHSGSACGCDNQIVQLEHSKQRRSYWYLSAKCGRCHQAVRLYVSRRHRRYTIDPEF